MPTPWHLFPETNSYSFLNSSFTSAASIAKHSDYQDQSFVANQDNRVFAHAADPRNHFQQVQEPAAVPSLQQTPQVQQQQFNQAPTQYNQHPATGLMQVPSYYPMYAAPPTTQQSFHQQQIDQQYPVYLIHVNHAQPYNLPQQSRIADASTVATSVRPPNQTTSSEIHADVPRTVQGPPPPYVQVPPNQFHQQYYGISYVQPQTQTFSTEADAEVTRTVQGPPPTYVQVPPNQFQHQYYAVQHVQPQTRTTSTETDAAEVRRTVQAPTPTPTYVQVPPNQYQQQYYGVPHVHPRTQTITTGQAATANYSYNYTNPPHDQLTCGQTPLRFEDNKLR